MLAGTYSKRRPALAQALATSGVQWQGHASMLKMNKWFFLNSSRHAPNNAMIRAIDS